MTSPNSWENTSGPRPWRKYWPDCTDMRRKHIPPSTTDCSAERSPANLTELAGLGADSGLARRLLAGMAKAESDDEWQEDLSAASTDWVRRLLSANLQIDQAEVDVLIQKTDGRILENWDISNPKAYEHYQRAMELQMQGRIDEALAHVIKAVELDLLDPANHFTLGSCKRRDGNGAR